MPAQAGRARRCRSRDRRAERADARAVPYAHRLTTAAVSSGSCRRPRAHDNRPIGEHRARRCENMALLVVGGYHHANLQRYALRPLGVPDFEEFAELVRHILTWPPRR